MPPPKLPLTSIFDLLVPWLWMSMKPSAVERDVVAPSVPVVDEAPPGWNVMLFARDLELAERR